MFKKIKITPVMMGLLGLVMVPALSFGAFPNTPIEPGLTTTVRFVDNANYAPSNTRTSVMPAQWNGAPQVSKQFVCCEDFGTTRDNYLMPVNHVMAYTVDPSQIMHPANGFNAVTVSPVAYVNETCDDYHLNDPCKAGQKYPRPNGCTAHYNAGGGIEWDSPYEVVPMTECAQPRMKSLASIVELQALMKRQVDATDLAINRNRLNSLFVSKVDQMGNRMIASGSYKFLTNLNRRYYPKKSNVGLPTDKKFALRGFWSTYTKPYEQANTPAWVSKEVDGVNHELPSANGARDFTKWDAYYGATPGSLVGGPFNGKQALSQSKVSLSVLDYSKTHPVPTLKQQASQRTWQIVPYTVFSFTTGGYSGGLGYGQKGATTISSQNYPTITKAITNSAPTLPGNLKINTAAIIMHHS